MKKGVGLYKNACTDTGFE